MTDNNVLQAKWVVISLRYQDNKTKLLFSFISLTLIHYVKSQDWIFFLFTFPLILNYVYLYVCIFVGLCTYECMCS